MIFTSLLKRARAGLGSVASSALAAGMALGALGAAQPAQAQTVLWQDDFANTGGSVDSSKWDVSTNSNYIHRTRFGAAPQVLAEGSTTFARLSMQSYNPNAPGDKFQGSEMWSFPQWSVGPGLQWEARVRGTNVPKGICYSFFTYRRRDFAYDRDQEEIDFEFLSNWINSSDPGQRKSVWSNIWNSGYSGDGAVSLDGLDQTQWHTYTIRWRPTGVQWLIDGTSVRTNSTLVPDDQMAVCFNIWAPDSSWGTAYNSTLQPTANASASTSSYYDIDYVRVSRLAPATDQGSAGSGDGLTGVYYNTASASASNVPQFSDEKFSNFARRLNYTSFVWGGSAFDSRLGANNWGAVYSGQLQAQYSESTTLSLKTQSSNGVRLWLNNQLLINKAPVSGSDTTVESSATVALTAGTKYPIRVEFWDTGGVSSLELYWSSTSLTKQLVSPAQMYPVTLPSPALAPPLPGSYLPGQTITSSGAQLGSDIRYTTNGSEPDGSSAIFPAAGVKINSSTTILARATKDGYWPSAIVGGLYAVDATPPAVSVAAPHDTWSYTAISSGSGIVSDSGGAGLDRVVARLIRQSDGASWNPSSSTWGAATDIAATVSNGSWSVALPALADGAYTLRAQATDRAGNISDAATSSFFIDTTAPLLSIAAPVNGGFAASGSVASGSATDSGPGVSAVSATLKRLGDGAFWNGSAWAQTPTDLPADTSQLPAWSLRLPALDAGSYTLAVTALDWARNVSSASRTFSVDGAAPTISIAGPTDNAALRSGFVLNGSAADVGSGLASVGVHIQRASDGAFWNGGAWGTDFELPARLYGGANGGADWTLSVPAFADGAYVAVAVARDKADNSNSATVRWNADATAPAISVDDPAPGASLSTWSTPRGSLSDGASGSGVASVSVALRQGDSFWSGSVWTSVATSFAATVSGASWSWPASVALPSASNGAYVVEATAVDVAGNSATARAQFTIAVPVPTPTATAEPTATPVPTAEPTPTLAPTATPTAAPTTAPTATPTIAPTPLPVDRTPPVVSVVSPPHNSVWRTMPILRGLAGDNIGVARAQLSVRRLADGRFWNGAAWVASPALLQPVLSGRGVGGTWLFSRLPGGASLPAGLYTVTITATDAAGLRASSLSTFRIDLKAPTLAWLLPTAPASGAAITLASPPTRLLLRAVDDAASTRLADVALWRRSDGRYWNGRAWAVGVVALPLSAVDPTRTARPTSPLWQNGFALPSSSQWAPGSYALIGRAVDWASNAATARLEFTLAPPSPFVASTASAQASASTFALSFSGPLDAASAQSPARFRATVGGTARQIVAARYIASSQSVALNLAGEVAPGARVQVWWSGLLDSSRRSLSDGTAAASAR